MRNHRARLLRKLTDAEQDALVDIGLAHRIMAGHLDYRNMRYGDVPGKQPEDTQVWKIDLERRVRQWRAGLTGDPAALSVTCRVAEQDANLSEVARECGIGWATALRALKRGLQTYLTT